MIKTLFLFLFLIFYTNSYCQKINDSLMSILEYNANLIVFMDNLGAEIRTKKQFNEYLQFTERHPFTLAKANCKGIPERFQFFKLTKNYKLDSNFKLDTGSFDTSVCLFPIPIFSNNYYLIYDTFSKVFYKIWGMQQCEMDIFCELLIDLRYYSNIRDIYKKVSFDGIDIQLLKGRTNSAKWPHLGGN